MGESEGGCSVCVCVCVCVCEGEIKVKATTICIRRVHFCTAAKLMSWYFAPDFNEAVS